MVFRFWSDHHIEGCHSCMSRHIHSVLVSLTISRPPFRLALAPGSSGFSEENYLCFISEEAVSRMRQADIHVMHFKDAETKEPIDGTRLSQMLVL
jgi:hypothetical protein